MDRNSIALASMRVSITSLSARRAWIEISYAALDGASEIVALRKESVDRNFDNRVALIPHQVALRKESVDRNLAYSWFFTRIA